MNSPISKNMLVSKNEADVSNYAIVMVTFNRATSLSSILESIIHYSWEYKYFVIVDNCSDDETSSILKAYSLIPTIKIIRTDENVGHGAGIAKALKYLAEINAHVDYLIFLEDDSIPSRELPQTLLDIIVTPSFDFISPDGTIVKLGRRINVKPIPGEIKQADFCLFDGAVMRYDVVKKIGYPVEDWFMMVDDYEYCYRIRKAGFKIGIIHNSIHSILHLGGAGGFTRSTRWRGYYQMRNHILFLKTHFTLFHLFDFIILQGKKFIACFYPPDRYQRVGLRLTGLWHGIIGRRGRTLDPQTLLFKK